MPEASDRNLQLDGIRICFMTDLKIYYISNWGVNQNKKASSKTNWL